VRTRRKRRRGSLEGCSGGAEPDAVSLCFSSMYPVLFSSSIRISACCSVPLSLSPAKQRSRHSLGLVEPCRERDRKAELAPGTFRESRIHLFLPSRSLFFLPLALTLIHIHSYTLPSTSRVRPRSPSLLLVTRSRLISLTSLLPTPHRHYSKHSQHPQHLLHTMSAAQNRLAAVAGQLSASSPQGLLAGDVAIITGVRYALLLSRWTFC
jgi:hypothetical protein